MTLTASRSPNGAADTTVVATCWTLEAPTPSVLVDVAYDLPVVLAPPTPAGQGLCESFEPDAAPRAVLDLAFELDPAARSVARGHGSCPAPAAALGRARPLELSTSVAGLLRRVA